MRQEQTQLRPVAVFDYDGTCIDGQSGKLIATWLLKNGYLSARGATGLTWWGVRYKFHMPYRQEHSRELIFRDLGKLTPSEIDELMVRFHKEVLLPLYRPMALQTVAQRKEEGCACVLVSATFDAIAREAALYLGVDGYVATRMEVDDAGQYTGKVLGDVIAGEEKVDAARAWADEALGQNAWRLAYAYGDHHSDTELLTAAEHPVAVCPGPTLKRIARERNWPVVNWKVQ